MRFDPAEIRAKAAQGLKQAQMPASWPAMPDRAAGLAGFPGEGALMFGRDDWASYWFGLIFAASGAVLAAMLTDNPVAVGLATAAAFCLAILCLSFSR